MHRDCRCYLLLLLLLLLLQWLFCATRPFNLLYIYIYIWYISCISKTKILSLSEWTPTTTNSNMYIFALHRMVSRVHPLSLSFVLFRTVRYCSRTGWVTIMSNNDNDTSTYIDMYMDHKQSSKQQGTRNKGHLRCSYYNYYYYYHCHMI